MKRLIVVFLATMLGLQSVAIVPAQAGLITTGEIIQGDASLASDRDRLNALMQREDIRQEFRRQGVDPNEAAARVAALSDAEVAEITARIDELPRSEQHTSELQSLMRTSYAVFCSQKPLTQKQKK